MIFPLPNIEYFFLKVLPFVMRVVKDSHVDYSSSSVRNKIPVIDLLPSAPIEGSIALSEPSKTPYYADGLQWKPFLGATTLESGMIGILNNSVEIASDGQYHKVLFDTDLSPLTPAHPSFTIDVPNSQIIINTDGNYFLYYNVTPSNLSVRSANQPETYVSQMVTSSTSPLAFDQKSGGFQLIGGNLVQPIPSSAENLSYVKLSGSWSGFLPSATTVNTSMAINALTQNVEFLFGEGGRMQYMGIIKIA